MHDWIGQVHATVDILGLLIHALVRPLKHKNECKCSDEYAVLCQTIPMYMDEGARQNVTRV